MNDTFRIVVIVCMTVVLVMVTMASCVYQVALECERTLRTTGTVERPLHGCAIE